MRSVSSKIYIKISHLVRFSTDEIIGDISNKCMDDLVYKMIWYPIIDRIKMSIYVPVHFGI